MTVRYFPFAAWAGLTAMAQRYPLNKPTGHGGIRYFHHQGHARGMLYWWGRAASRTPGPYPLPERRWIMSIDFETRNHADDLLDAFRYMTQRPPNAKKNCVYVKLRTGGHVIVTDADYVEWVYP